ncbi:MAG: tyrosine-type recombinase/integrase [Pseudomonadota bacterium]
MENYRPSRKDIKAETTKRRDWTQSDIEKVRALGDFDDPIFALWFLCLHHGTRVEELPSSCVRQLDLDAETFTIEDGKNEASEDVMPMHRATVDTFQRLTENKIAGGNLLGLRPDAKGDCSGNVVKRAGRWVRKHITADPSLTIYHSSRHTLATRLEEAGVEPHLIKRVERHALQDDTFGRFSMGPGLKRLGLALNRVDFGFGL